MGILSLVTSVLKLIHVILEKVWPAIRAAQAVDDKKKKDDRNDAAIDKLLNGLPDAQSGQHPDPLKRPGDSGDGTATPKRN